jgi:putative membrane protein
MAMAAALVFVAAGARAQTQTAGMALGPSELVAQLHQADQLEIAAGQLAQRKGNAPDVKAYGRMLESDHQAADIELTDYANRNNVSLDDLPEKLRLQDQTVRARLDSLSALSGPDFDRAFVQLMQQSHARTIAMIDASRLAIPDPRLQDLLGSLEPTLRAHRQIAENLLRDIPPPVTTGAGPCPGCGHHTAPR